MACCFVTCMGWSSSLALTPFTGQAPCPQSPPSMDAVWLLHSAVLTSCYPAQCPWLFWVLVLESSITDGLQCPMEVEEKACILFLFLDCEIFLSCKLSVFVNISTLFSFPPLGRVLLCSLGWPYTWLSFLSCSSSGALDMLHSSRSPSLLEYCFLSAHAPRGAAMGILGNRALLPLTSLLGVLCCTLRGQCLATPLVNLSGLNTF